MKNMFFGLVMCLLAGIVVCGQAVDVSKMPTIQTTGTAEINVVPDQALFSTTISKSSRELSAAKTENDRVVGEIQQIARRFGIEKPDIKTDYISVREKFDKRKVPDTDDEYENVFAGYTVARKVVIKLKDLSKFEAFFGDLIKSGVSEVNSVVFETTKLREHKDQARANAIKAAREKANSMAAEIGQAIGKAVSIEEKDIDGYRSPYANISSNSFSYSDSDEEPESFMIGTITIKAQVVAEFLLN